jgi:hypothetical protein
MERDHAIEMASKKDAIAKLQRELEAAKKQYQELRNHTILKQGNDAFQEEFARLKKQYVALVALFLYRLICLSFRYFFALAVGLKLNLALQGQPCNVDIMSLYEQVQALDHPR